MIVLLIMIVLFTGCSVASVNNDNSNIIEPKTILIVQNNTTLDPLLPMFNGRIISINPDTTTTNEVEPGTDCITMYFKYSDGTYHLYETVEFITVGYLHTNTFIITGSTLFNQIN